MGKKIVIKGADWMMDAVNVETIGKFYSSLEGLPQTDLGFTYVYKQPLNAGRILFYYQSATSGSATFKFKLFTKSGNTFTQVTETSYAVTKNQWVDIGLNASEGQYIGIYGGDDYICYSAGGEYGIPHFSATQGNVTSVDATTDFSTWFSFVVAIKTDA